YKVVTIYYYYLKGTKHAFFALFVKKEIMFHVFIILASKQTLSVEYYEFIKSNQGNRQHDYIKILEISLWVSQQDKDKKASIYVSIVFEYENMRDF
ncbi:hypothetical protein ACJX0J_009766, partial [Zea mays]